MIRRSELTGELLSEQDPAAQLGVSRDTVREALKEFEDEGLIVSRHGIGTSVARYNGNENIRYNISVLDSTIEIIPEHGYVPDIQSVFVDICMVGPEISERLGSNTPVKILYIKRVRTADDTPIVLMEDYIPCVGGMLEGLSSHAIPSLFQSINRYASVSLTNCSIHAVLSDKRQTDRLSLTDSKTPLLL